MRRASLAVCAALAFLLHPNALAFAQSNDDVKQIVGQILNALITQAIQDHSQAAHARAEKSWEGLDPIVDLCLRRNYGIASEDLAQAGVSATDQKIRPYVEDCTRFAAQVAQDSGVQATQPEAPQIHSASYTQSSPGLYVRSSKAIANPQSQYNIVVTATEAGGGSGDALLAGAERKAGTICAGEHAVSAFRLYSEADPNSALRGISEPWIMASIDCSVPSPAVPGTETVVLTIDDLTKTTRSDDTRAIPGAAYFDVHSVLIDAPYDTAFDAVVAALKDGKDSVARADHDKGIVITVYPLTSSLPRDTKYVEQFFAVLDPVTDASTRVTFKLLASVRDASRPEEMVFGSEDQDTVAWRAQQFVQEIRDHLPKAR